MLGGRSNTSLYLRASSINLREEGSSATDSLSSDVTDVTDVSPMSVGRRKKGNAVRAIFSAIKNVLTFLPVPLN